jgi:acetyl-CoA carboxylase / biotin carboxylase 1
MQVTRADDVASSFRQVQGEIPGSPIFVMKMAARARHLEVQLLADKHGQVIQLIVTNLSIVQHLTKFSLSSRRSH